VPGDDERCYLAHMPSPCISLIVSSPAEAGPANLFIEGIVSFKIDIIRIKVGGNESRSLRPCITI